MHDFCQRQIDGTPAQVNKVCLQCHEKLAIGGLKSSQNNPHVLICSLHRHPRKCSHLRALGGARICLSKPGMLACDRGYHHEQAGGPW